MKATQPFWSLGSKIPPLKDKNNFPGPGTYDQIDPNAYFPNSARVKFGTNNRSQAEQKEFIGPTKYNPNISTFSTKSGKVGCETARPDLSNRSQLKFPGPGAHTIIEESQITGAYKYSMPKDNNRSMHIRNSSPNVSTYHPILESVKPKTSSWNMGTGQRSSVIDKRNWVLPPGLYNFDKKENNLLGLMGKDKKCKIFRNSSVDDIHNLGPGSHDPDNFFDAHQAKRGWTLAKKLNDIKKDASPSPDRYKPDSSQTRIKGAEYKIGTQRRKSMTIKNDSPGAKYFIKDNSPSKSWVIGSEKRPLSYAKIDKNIKNGPASYTPRDDFSKQIKVLFSFGRDSKLKNPKELGDSPPCSTYNLKGSFENGKKWGFGSKERDAIDFYSRKKNMPGPGSYNLKRSLDAGVKFSFSRDKKLPIKKLGCGSDNFYEMRSSMGISPTYMLPTADTKLN